MAKMRKYMRKKGRANERGQALVIVLICMLLAGLMIPPLVNFMGTGVQTGQVFDTKTDELLAADAGIEDAMWQIKYDNLPIQFTGYSPYDYAGSWPYVLNNTKKINNLDVSINIQNIWIPKDLPAPSKAMAKRVIEGLPAVPPDPATPPKLIVTGNVIDIINHPTDLTKSISTFQIKLMYDYATPEDLRIQTLGVWLPAGFHYKTDGTCNLPATYYTGRQIDPYDGGEAVVWTFNNYPFKGSTSPVKPVFPGVNLSGGNPLTSTITFQIIGPKGASPEAVAWVNTNTDLTLGGSSPVTYAWDGDTKIYHMTSDAGGTGVEAYTAKSEIRELGSAIAGDYRAVGNSLMVDDHPGSPPIRDTLLAYSETTVNDIPLDASIAQARLYWSGWLNGNSTTMFNDTCDTTIGSSSSKWIQTGSDWSVSSNRFRGHQTTASPATNLTMKTALDLSPYVGRTVTLTWKQSTGGTLESADGLDYGFSTDGGSAWTDFQAFRDDNPTTPIPPITLTDAYLKTNFKLRFKLVGCLESNEYVYLDDIIISVAATQSDPSVTFTVNGQATAVTASPSHITTLENKVDTYSYSCYYDATSLVQQFSTNNTGNGVYRVGGVQADTGDEWSYAGWSLIIIYTSADTKGNMLFLYDIFTYCTMNTTLKFPIGGFLVPQPVTGEVNAAKLTCFVGEGDTEYSGDRLQFIGQSLTSAYLSDGTAGGTTNVWNSQSTGMSVSGVDIDTFYVPWGSPVSSGLIKPDDVRAEIDMPTQTDSWNLVYVIVAFRSETKTGGVLTYIIQG
jgi:hypothetical protein